MPSTIEPPIGEMHFRLLRLLETQPKLSQRDLSRELGASLGKVNYCLNALVDKGFVKVRNFRDNQNKLSYAYLLTPKGIESKAASTVHFLQRKMGEYESLRLEIMQLQQELDQSTGSKSK
jgi:EPS-associated MarR family transcriptional regulator